MGAEEDSPLAEAIDEQLKLAGRGPMNRDERSMIGLPSREIDPRTEADARIAQALQTVVDADSDEELRKARRDYTQFELEELFYCLAQAARLLRKLPDGEKAYDAALQTLESELARRGRAVDLGAARFRREAVKLVRRTYGRNVDLSVGTTGAALVDMVEAEMATNAKMLEDLVSKHAIQGAAPDDLAATREQPE